jgi:HK97 family phage major capsid protein
LFDNLVFTDATDGLLYQPDAGEGWKTLSVGTAVTDLDWSEMIGAPLKVVGSARRNGKYYMHPTIWNALRVQRWDGGGGAGTGNFFFDPSQGKDPNIGGVPVELVDVMPALGEITANEPFAVFGDLSRVMIHVKRVLETKVFDSGVVKDAGGTDINLITQDSWAVRATTRVKPQTRFPAAFVIIGTGTVS